MSAKDSLFSDFKRSLKPDRLFPVVRRIDRFYDPLGLYRVLRADRTPSVLLESARFSPRTGRYSIIGRDPFLALEARRSEIILSSYGQKETFYGDPFKIIGRILGLFQSNPSRSELPYTGGAVGYFGYEAKDYLGFRSTQNKERESRWPDIYLAFFNEGVVLDHYLKATFLFTNIKPGKNPKKNYDRAISSLHRLEKDLETNSRSTSISKHPSGAPQKSASRLNFSSERRIGPEDHFQLEASMSREEFIRKVKRIKHHIRRGDIYQANLSQRFSFSIQDDPLDLYEKLRAVNPSPFFGFLDAVDFQIVSGSPERLVKLGNGTLETRPIAGTRARGVNEKEDKALSMELLLNHKERAEHIMLVDLERNDLGRVSDYGSVCVDELMTVENYSHVKHIVSNVRGTLRKDLDAVDALKAFFPGGTITGVPKIRCMQILDELEPVERGPYTGSLGYFSFSGNMDFNIIIRSLTVKAGTAYLQVGAGIVADSVASKEYEETLYKAEALLTAVFGKKNTRVFLKKRGATHRVP